MGDEDGGDPEGLDELPELDLHRVPELRVEGVEGLVEEEDGRLEHEDPGDRDPLLLAARELARVAVGEAAEGDEVERLRHPVIPFGPRDLAHGEAVLHVAPDAQVGKEGVALEDHPDVAPVGRHEGHVALSDHDATLLGDVEARDAAKEGGLAAARGSEQGHDLAAVDAERAFLEHPGRARRTCRARRPGRAWRRSSIRRRGRAAARIRSRLRRSRPRPDSESSSRPRPRPWGADRTGRAGRYLGGEAKQLRHRQAPGEPRREGAGGGVARSRRVRDLLRMARLPVDGTPRPGPPHAVRSPLLDDLRAARIEGPLGRLVVEPGEEPAHLLAARGEEVEPRQGGEEGRALGGGEPFARIRDDPGAKRARRLRVANEAAHRHRGEDHRVGAAPARRRSEGAGPRPPLGVPVVGRRTPGRPRGRCFPVLEASPPGRPGAGSSPSRSIPSETRPSRTARGKSPQSAVRSRTRPPAARAPRAA